MNTPKYCIMALLGLSLMGTANAEQAPSPAELNTLPQSRGEVARQALPATPYFDFKSDKHKTSLQQVQSTDENDSRVNVAVVLAVPQRDALNLRLGALSFELPDNPYKAHELDPQPFFYVGFDRRW